MRSRNKTPEQPKTAFNGWFGKRAKTKIAQRIAEDLVRTQKRNGETDGELLKAKESARDEVRGVLQNFSRENPLPAFTPEELNTYHAEYLGNLQKNTLLTFGRTLEDIVRSAPEGALQEPMRLLQYDPLPAKHPGAAKRHEELIALPQRLQTDYQGVINEGLTETIEEKAEEYHKRVKSEFDYLPEAETQAFSLLTAQLVVPKVFDGRKYALGLFPRKIAQIRNELGSGAQVVEYIRDSLQTTAKRLLGENKYEESQELVEGLTKPAPEIKVQDYRRQLPSTQ